MIPKVRPGIENGSPIFLTDEEFETLFGPDITQATRLLGKYAVHVCSECGGECCRRIGCEFHSDLFSMCPIHAYRPAKCRLYHCDRILENEYLTATEREMLNRPAVEASKHLRQQWGLKIFIDPPLTVGNVSWLKHLGLEAEANDVMRSLNRGKTVPKAAAARLVLLVEQYRRGCQRSSGAL